MKTLRRQSGVSLIEVLVVLVLLLIGIFSVIRLFPPGFLVNKQAANSTYASRLAKQEVDRFTNSAANLPDAIVPVVPVAAPVPGGFVFQVDLDATPDDLTTITTPLYGIDPYYFSNVNKIRRVIGESVRIPVPSPTVAGLGAVYVLSSGPVFNSPFLDNASGQYVGSILVYGAPLFRRIEDSSEPPFLFGPAQYAIDYEAASVAFFPVDYPREFVITYNYYSANNRVQTVLSEPISVPANDGTWKKLSKVPVVPDSDTVSRAFIERQLVNDPFTDDPYEFKILSQNVGSFANVGVLIFNPRGRDYTEQTPNGPVPLTAHIDYNVLDWRVIREDRPMPGSEPFTVALTLKNIKILNEFDDDQTRYPGLFRDTSIPASDRVDMLIYDLTTGERVPPGNFTVNHRQGQVTFTPIYGAAHASGTFRFFYKAHGEWALQVQKACTSYRPHVSSAQGDGANVGLCEYYVGNSDATNGGSPTRLYFPLLDAGKTISIRELWYKDANGNSIRIGNETYQINSNRAFFETLNGTTPRVLTWIDLKDKHPNDAQAWDPVPAGQLVIGVQGVSFKARVLWTDGGTVSQIASGNVASTRLKKVDVDTFLTRSPN